jgi:hypothetical protein
MSKLGRNPFQAAPARAIRPAPRPPAAPAGRLAWLLVEAPARVALLGLKAFALLRSA